MKKKAGRPSLYTKALVAKTCRRPAPAGDPEPRPPARDRAIPLYQPGLDRLSSPAVLSFIPVLSFQR